MSTCTLDLAHLVHLAGLMRDRPFELGPAPTENPAGWHDTIVDQLREAGLIGQSHGELTEYAHTLLDPLITYTDAYWGMLLLHNEQQPVTFDIEDKWLEHLRDALVTASVTSPRVYFLLARTGDLMTCGVRIGNQVHLTQHTTTADRFAADAGQFLTNLADPDHTWSPIAMTPISLPYDLLSDPETVPARGPASNAPEQTRKAYAATVRSWSKRLAADGRLDRKTIARAEQLLGYDHVASMQVTYSHGPHRMTSDRSVTVDYFHAQGAAVARPRKVADGSLWRTISPATGPEVTKALRGLQEIPQSPRDYLVTATDGNISADEALKSVVPADLLETIETIQKDLDEASGEAD